MCSVIVSGHAGVGPMAPTMTKAPRKEDSPNPSSSSERLTMGYEQFEPVACKTPPPSRSVPPIGAVNSGLENHPVHNFGAPQSAHVEELPLMSLKGQISKDYCRQCGATDTPQWRNGPCGPRTLCNACGIRLHRQTQKSKQKCLRVRKKIVKKSKRPASSHPRSPSTPVKTIKVTTNRSDDQLSGPTSQKNAQDRKRVEGKKFTDISSDQRRPRRKAALAAIETTRGFTKGFRRGYNNRWKQRRSHMVHGSHSLQRFMDAKLPCTGESMEPVDFTGAVDLVGLSRSASTVETSSGRAVAVKLEELGQDLLSHLTTIPQNSMVELQGIECELLSAHWEMQASEMAEQAVAKVLDEQKQDAIRKRTRYWKARDRLERFIHANQGIK